MATFQEVQKGTDESKRLAELAKQQAASDITAGRPQTFQAGTATPITGADLTPVQPIQVPPTPVPTPIDTTGGQATINELNKLFTSATTPDTKSTDSLTALMEKYLSTATPPQSQTGAYEEAAKVAGISTKEQEVITKQAASQAARNRLAAVNAELAGLSAETQAIPIRLQEEATGRGITEGGLAPIQAGELRKLALRTLPVQAKALGIQAEVFAAQGDVELSQQTLKLAQDRLSTIFGLKTKDAENTYNYWKDLRNKVFDFATEAQKTKLAQQQKKDDQEFQLVKDRINNLQALAKDLITNGQADLAAKITQLDPKSKTFDADLAALQAQAKSKTTATNTSIVEVNGKKLLINDLTGETIKDLGTSISKAEGRDVEVSQFLQSKKGTDGFVSAESYQEGLRKFIAGGGTQANFVASFPQQTYLRQEEIDKLPAGLKAIQVTPQKALTADQQALINEAQATWNAAKQTYQATPELRERIIQKSKELGFNISPYF